MIDYIADDDLVVSYKPEKSIIKFLSGVKITAILTFIPTYGKSTIILDQPEEYLDNRLEYDLIVTRLKEAKEKRQIIVVTYNANIPVNWDAGDIVAMDSVTGKIHMQHCHQPLFLYSQVTSGFSHCGFTYIIL